LISALAAKECRAEGQLLEENLNIQTLCMLQAGIQIQQGATFNSMIDIY
jgi:hypothetical protein